MSNASAPSPVVSLDAEQVRAVQLLHAFVRGADSGAVPPLDLPRIEEVLAEVLAGALVVPGPVSTEYSAYPDHPLFGVPAGVLEVARDVLRTAAHSKDVDPEHADPIADSVVAELRDAGMLLVPPNSAALRWRRR